ncbi:MAG: hypothetical protein JO047_02590, partial [Alphaproteobacteria bacterium]|nr:hypothetical protein [Alphaproteobacteria bacterium]
MSEPDGVSPAHPPTPPSVLHVGMIGHRNLPAQDPSVLGRTIDEVLARIAAQASGHAELRAVCALAAGADLLLAAAALAHGYTLLAPLPFPRDIYREDLADEESRSAYDAILARAARVYELNGDRKAGDAYQAVGRLLLEQSDLLVAVWDGEREKGIGGTGEIVREALAAGIPVVVIASAAPHAVRVLERTARANRPIEAVVQGMLTVDGAVLERLRRYRNEVLGRRVRVPRLREAIEYVLLGLPGRRGRRVQRPQWHDPPALAGALGQIDAVLRPPFAAADELAIRYGELYRLSSTLRFLALLPATLATFFAFYGSNTMSRLGFLVLVIVTLGTLLIWFLDRKTGWHRRFLDYRLLAEHLRHARL